MRRGINSALQLRQREVLRLTQFFVPPVRCQCFYHSKKYPYFARSPNKCSPVMYSVFHPSIRFFTAIFLLLVHVGLFAQIPADGNIVPNPGFERYESVPIGWFYKGAHFGQVMKYWYSATTSSPDVYGPKVRVPIDWAEKGFGKQTPHSGKSMIGLTLFGCLNGKPHCREYIQIQLAEPLVIGQMYKVEFWTTHLARSLQINNMGTLFSMEKIERPTDELLPFVPQVKAKQIVEGTGGKWVKVSGTFKAKEEAEYLTLGNFSDDKNTLSQPYRADGYNYGYYYFDDLLVKKIPPFLNVPVKPDDLTRLPLKTGDTIRLKNIYFDHDRAELMPRSFVELNKLLKILRDTPTMSIEIVGHTDNAGTDAYNLDLSKRRAQTVLAFLTEHKIAAKRLRARGEGEGRAITTNDTEEGRAMNRRVEFVVLKR